MGQKNTGNCIDIHLTPISQSRCHGSTGIIMTKTLASVFLSIVIDLLTRNYHKSCRKYPFLQLPNLQVLLLSEPWIKKATWVAVLLQDSKNSSLFHMANTNIHSHYKDTSTKKRGCIQIFDTLSTSNYLIISFSNLQPLVKIYEDFDIHWKPL